MPIYDFKNIDTGEIFTKMMSYDDKVKFLEENLHITSIITKAPSMSYSSNPLKAAGDGWKDVQNKIKNGLPPKYRDNIKTK